MENQLYFNGFPAVVSIILASWRVKMYRIMGLGEGSSRRGGFGEVSERLIELVSKTSVLFIEYRGFESRPLRYFFTELRKYLNLSVLRK